MTAPVTPTFSHISHETFLQDVEAVAQAIAATSFRPEFIVGIGRGGLVPGAYLSHRLDIPLLSVDLSSKVERFADALLAELAAKTSAGQRILVVDDINDSGRTIAYLRRTLAADGADPECVRFAVLINNTRSETTVDYWSRTIDRSVEKDWFVFPWEAVSSRATLVADANEVPARIA